MNPTIKGIFPSLGEVKFELVVRVQRCGIEFPLRALDGVGNVIMVDPCDSRPHFDGERYRTVHKVIDQHLRRGVRP